MPRLTAFSATSDGFAIAELDLKERGMGELAGARQSGGVALRFANFATDLPLLEAARRAAGEIIARDPALARPQNAAYRERIVARYERVRAVQGGVRAVSGARCQVSGTAPLAPST